MANTKAIFDLHCGDQQPATCMNTMRPFSGCVLFNKDVNAVDWYVQVGTRLQSAHELTCNMSYKFQRVEKISGQCKEMSFDVCGSVHHSIIHIKSPTRCNSISKFYFIFK
jgi:hypothetical protein